MVAIDTGSIGDSDLVIVRILRRYRALRSAGDDASLLSPVVAFAQELRVPPTVTVALASVFELAEAILGRALSTECCCSRCLSSDEQAMVRLLGSLREADLGGMAAVESASGLSRALACAVLSVRRLCGEDGRCRSDRPDWTDGSPVALAA